MVVTIVALLTVSYRFSSTTRGSVSWRRASVRLEAPVEQWVLLEDEVREKLTQLLSEEQFVEEVRRNVDCDEAAFDGTLFMPMPYTEETPRGVPSKLEAVLDSPAFAVVNVPPLFMFKSKATSPSRLCAVYKVSGRRSGCPPRSTSPTTATASHLLEVDAEDDSEDVNLDDLVV